jgi:hypothetical protein
MDACIYDKTDKGREEIATRKYQLAPRLRTLLVMIDGRHSPDSLLKDFAGLGLDQDCVSQLLDQGYICLVSGGAAPAPSAPARLGPAAARARRLVRLRAAGSALQSPPPPAPQEPAGAAPPGVTSTEEADAVQASRD